MDIFIGTGIFWVTVCLVPATIFLSIIFGRALLRLLPSMADENFFYYLVPTLGLAFLVILASFIGKFFSFSQESVLWIFVFFTGIIFFLDKNKKQLFSYSLTVSLFSFFCGLSLLAPLFLYGAINPHNDTFTYLAQSDWLQKNVFSENIPQDETTPLTTQVVLYQVVGLRMGASFLLAFLQAIFNLRWAYEVYPAVVITVLAIGCLAIGAPIVYFFPKAKREKILLLLTFPALSFGGLVFGANFGFFPQTVGMALGVGVLALSGISLAWIVGNELRKSLIIKVGFVCAVVLAGVIFSYSEIAPFFLLAIFGGGVFWLTINFKKRRELFIFLVSLFGFSVILLNEELVRFYSALKTQSSAVTGVPVEWSLLGFIGHAVGVHGGSWDVFQWENFKNINIYLSLLALSLLLGIIWLLFNERAFLKKTFLKGVSIPIVTTLFLFLLFFIYFRYSFISPFDRGIGQSWSQFKLSDWAHPFLAIFILGSLVSIEKKIGKNFNFLIGGIFLLGLVSTLYFGIIRVQPLMQYYKTKNLDEFYKNFRKKTLSFCPVNSRIYLDLGGQDLKFRQMALLYLSDKEVVSNWLDDGYIFPHLKNDSKEGRLNINDCVISPAYRAQNREEGESFSNFFNINVSDGYSRAFVVSSLGSYETETDGKNWWNWVERRVVFNLQPVLGVLDPSQTKISFEYGTLGSQNLKLSVKVREGEDIIFFISSGSKGVDFFEKVIDLSPSQIVSLAIESDGRAEILGEKDKRKASFIIRNINIESKIN